MKVICKKSRYSEHGLKVLDGNFYDIISSNSFFKMKKENGEYSHFSNEIFEKYFYSIEETQCILRTELIDKILDGSVV